MAGPASNYTPEILEAINAYASHRNAIDEKHAPGVAIGDDATAVDEMTRQIDKLDYDPTHSIGETKPMPNLQSSNPDADALARNYQALMAQLSGYYNEYAMRGGDLNKFGTRPNELERANYPGS